MRMMNCIGAAAVAALAGSAMGQITPIGPFTGPYTEGFETQSPPCPPCFFNCIPGRIFNNTADVCDSTGSGMDVATGWSFSCTIFPHAGGHFAGSAGGPARITFDVPVSGFGGYFGSNSGTDGAVVTFSDSANNVIGTSNLTTAGCTWTWNGWQSTTPIKSILITGTFNGGGFIDMDDLEYLLSGPLGACCLTNGSCEVNNSAGCSAAGGIYRGDNSPCATANCPQPPQGACCLGLGGCTVMTAAQCTSACGTYNGDNSTCAAAGCVSTLVTNGGFETGDFTGWTLGGEGDAENVQSGVVHCGHFASQFGPFTTPDTLSQTLTAHVGDHVTVDFWYQAQGSTNSFSAALGNTTLISLSNDTSHTSWTEFTFNVVVDTENPVLQFSFLNPPIWTYLDDVRVSPGPATASCYPNCDHSTSPPCLNVQDFGCFLNKFAAGDTYANCDHSTTPPVLNVQDFGCFLNSFAAGCSNC